MSRRARYTAWSLLALLITMGSTAAGEPPPDAVRIATAGDLVLIRCTYSCFTSQRHLLPIDASGALRLSDGTQVALKGKSEREIGQALAGRTRALCSAGERIALPLLVRMDGRPEHAGELDRMAEREAAETSACWMRQEKQDRWDRRDRERWEDSGGALIWRTTTPP